MKKTILMAITVIFPLIISACNTVKGVGEDLQSSSDAVSKAVR